MPTHSYTELGGRTVWNLNSIVLSNQALVKRTYKPIRILLYLFFIQIAGAGWLLCVLCTLLGVCSAIQGNYKEFMFFLYMCFLSCSWNLSVFDWSSISILVFVRYHISLLFTQFVCLFSLYNSWRNVIRAMCFCPTSICMSSTHVCLRLNIPNYC